MSWLGGEGFGDHPLPVSSSAGLTVAESEIAADLFSGLKTQEVTSTHQCLPWGDSARHLSCPASARFC